MGADEVPVKTPAGQAELATRRLRLSQRHRTVLLLADGQRTEAQVRALAAQAGVPAACFDELLGLSLIALPQPSAVVGAAMSVTAARAAVAPLSSAPVESGASSPGEPRAAAPVESRATPSVEPRASAAAGPPPSGSIALIVGEHSLLPASGTLPPDSAALDSAASVPPPDSRLRSGTGAVAPAPADTAIDQARRLLLRVVRAETPVAGSLTLLRLRRARSRDELMQLLDDVEARVGKRHRSLSAAQTLASVRRLLAPLSDSSRTAA